jgi:hypothetical protein
LVDLDADEQKLYTFKCSLDNLDAFSIWRDNLEEAIEGGGGVTLEHWGSSSWAGISNHFYLYIAGIEIYQDRDIPHLNIGAGKFFSHENGADSFTVTICSGMFASLASGLRNSINEHLWNQESRLYFDLNCKTEKQTGYQSATSIYALWSGVASQGQAELFVPEFISLFLERGGISSGTESSRGIISESRPQRQWHTFPSNQ